MFLQAMAKPLTVTVHSASGSEVVVSVDASDPYMAKAQIHGEIERSGVPERSEENHRKIKGKS